MRRNHGQPMSRTPSARDTTPDTNEAVWLKDQTLCQPPSMRTAMMDPFRTRIRTGSGSLDCLASV